MTIVVNFQKKSSPFGKEVEFFLRNRASESGYTIERQHDICFTSERVFPLKVRLRLLLLAMILCLLLLCVNTAVLSAQFASQAAAQQHTRTLCVGQTRGKIYARDGTLLVDRTSRLLAAAAPCKATMELLRQTLSPDAAAQAMQTRAPLLLAVPSAVNTESVRTFSVPVRYAPDDCASHLVGTLGADGSGNTGVERAFDALLQAQGGTLSVRFAANANGQVLAGLDKQILDDNFNSRAGVVLTVEEAQQRIVENALQKSSIQSGCAVLMDTGTGEIRALASVPAMDRTNLSSADTAHDAFRNKALSVYAPGSVMKPLLAAFALEQGISPKHAYACSGEIRVGNMTFRCYGGKAHGKQTMADALRNSCNTYFIDLMGQMDAAAFLQFCRRLELDVPVTLCGSLQSERGVLPAQDDLLLPGQRALLAFGQGKLLLSPLHLLRCYHVLATGCLVQPAVLRGTMNERGLMTLAAGRTPMRILRESTVRTLRQLLTGAVAAGQSGAYSARIAIAGKTGTAQSGVYVNGKEICRTWFCGFFPAKNPHYVLVILSEDGPSGNAQCAPVCKEICERIVGYAADG